MRMSVRPGVRRARIALLDAFGKAGSVAGSFDVRVAPGELHFELKPEPRLQIRLSDGSELEVLFGVRNACDRTNRNVHDHAEET